MIVIGGFGIPRSNDLLVDWFWNLPSIKIGTDALLEYCGKLNRDVDFAM